MPPTPDEQMPATPDEQLTPIVQKAKALKVHVSTIYRWGTGKGVRGHRLRLLRIGGRTYIQHSDWVAFVNALNSPRGIRPNVTASMPSSKIDAELDAARI